MEVELQIKCQNCGVKGNIPDEKLKTAIRVRCPKCKTLIEIGDFSIRSTSTTVAKKPNCEIPSNSNPNTQPPKISKPKFKMGLFSLMINWSFGVLFVLFALKSITGSLTAAIAFLLISFLLLPPIRKRIFEKTGKPVSMKLRAVAIIVLLVIATAFTNAFQKEKEILHAQDQKRINAEKKQAIIVENIQYFQTNKIQILAELSTHLNNQEYRLVLTKAKRYTDANDKDLDELVVKAKEQDLLQQVKDKTADNLEAQKKLYAELKSLIPSNHEYVEKYRYFASRLAEKQLQQRLAAEKENKIKAQFSPWDGSHRALERLVKESMNDPNSYEHDKTVYRVTDDHIVVTTNFRGKNAFGGVIRDSVIAKFDYNGKLIAIMN